MKRESKRNMQPNFSKAKPGVKRYYYFGDTQKVVTLWSQGRCDEHKQTKNEAYVKKEKPNNT